MPHESRKNLKRIDPRGPYVLDTRTLGRRPGSMCKEFRTVPALPDLGVEMVTVPVDSDLELDLRLEAVMEGVLVSGTVRASLRGECARCLEGFDSSTEVDVQELYFYPDQGSAVRRDREHCRSGGEAEEEEHRLDGDLIDFEPVVRDAVVLSLPLSPLCQDDCSGLCSICGVRLADSGRDHRHNDAVDPRWAALQGLTEQRDQEG